MRALLVSAPALPPDLKTALRGDTCQAYRALVAYGLPEGDARALLDLPLSDDIDARRHGPC
jgi:hypothetical protein